MLDAGLVTVIVMTVVAPMEPLAGANDLVTVGATGGTIVSVSVALLLPGVGSLTPEGGETVATFVIVELTAPVTFPVTKKVTLPPLGSVGITIPTPCINATVVLPAAGHTAPPVAEAG